MKVIDKINDKLNELNEGELFYSFEYFPPKTQTGVANLIERIQRMTELNPLFVDMTWGAGGRTSESTIFLSAYIQNYLQIDVLMHITCRCQSKENLDFALESAKKNNIKNLLILRGDPPQGVENYDWTKDHFHYAEDLIKYVRELYKDFFCIVVAGYPATHIDSKNKEEDLYYLKRKVDAGADLIITQLFYDPEEYLNFELDCKKNGINVPILPGILPVNNYNSFKKIIDLCKLKVPESMIQEIELIKGDDEKIKEFGIANTINIIETLKNRGVKGVHLYTMNLEKSVTEIIERMGLKKVGRKSLPFNPRNVKDKNNCETVRPIFWAKNEKSYISKTWYWDEYPNGIWGDSRSPAFGNNEEHLHTFGDNLLYLKGANQDSMKKQIGTKFESLNDISQMFINFLDKKIKKIPWAETREIQDELIYIKDLLYKMNTMGLFTINSQPSVNGKSSNDSILGWGPSNGYVYQRMYIEFFVSKHLIANLIKMLQNNPNIIYQAVTHDGETHYESFTGNVVCALTWGVFPNKEIVQPTIYDSEVFKIWKEEAFGKFNDWINIYDENDENQSKTKEFLKKTKEDIYLVTLVDNDYVEPTLEKILHSFLDSLQQ